MTGEEVAGKSTLIKQDVSKDDGPGIVLFMGTYPPRECGIATFTRDLSSAIGQKYNPSIKIKILAMNRNGINIYNYPDEVMYQISDTDIQDYIDVAKKINSNPKIKMISIQHEFGIFGGTYGDYLLKFLDVMEKPVVVTFHSVLPSPNDQLRNTVRAISKRVDTIVVMNSLAVGILKEDYELTTQIKVIPHGIPNVSYSRPDTSKKDLSLAGKLVVSSFGMIGPGKGYEYVIESLPEVIKKFPNLLYLIVGETHPVVRKNEGEKYRNYLEQRIKDLGIEKNVKFYNKYTTIGEIIKFLTASDIYLSPGRDHNQITSGTLSYAVGCGRPVISTPFLHAREVVNQERGELVDFENEKPFTDALIKLLGNPELRRKMEKNCYSFTRIMTWPNVAISYKEIFDQYAKFPESYESTLPTIKVYHLNRLTDEFGIIQFAEHIIPDMESGYTLDDNARALMAAGMLYDYFRTPNYLKLVRTYLDYIRFVQQENGMLYNLVDKKKTINFEEFSDEAHGRAIRSLGYISSQRSLPKKLRKYSENILRKSLSASIKLRSPRALASTIAGLYHYNKEHYSESNISLIKTFADELVRIYKVSAHDEWEWFEPYLTYANSKLSEAMFYAYICTQKKEYLDIGKASLDFLCSKTFENGMFMPVGQEEWHMKDGTRSYYDQQPVEAAGMVVTLQTASQILNDPIYKKQATTAFQWFLGKNVLNQVVYNEYSGGCHDGLGENCINMNQGAESTLAYLIARMSLVDL